MKYSLPVLKRATIVSIVITVLAYGIGIAIEHVPTPAVVGGTIIGVFILYIFVFGVAESILL